MVGLASAWAMARRRPKEYRRKVDAATRCSGVCPQLNLRPKPDYSQRERRVSQFQTESIFASRQLSTSNAAIDKYNICAHNTELCTLYCMLLCGLNVIKHSSMIFNGWNKMIGDIILIKYTIKIDRHFWRREFTRWR